jgi:hypothetical protein
MTFMLYVPPSLHDQDFTALLSNKHDRYTSPSRMDVEEHPVFAEEPKLALGYGIRPECLQVPAFREGIRREPIHRFLQDRSASLSPQCP